MNVVVIPARSGSKGVPNKNIFPFRGKPLIAWASLCAQATGIIDKVILSTDSEEYAEIGKKYGCEVPYLRPHDLAADASNINHVLLDLIKRCDGKREWKTLSLLEPTCPLRTPEMIKYCVQELLNNEGLHSCITVSEVSNKYHPRKQFELNPEGYLSFIHQAGNATVNRQEIPKSYIRNGAVYSLNVSHFLEVGNIIGLTTKPLIVDDYLINIDEMVDIENLKTIEKNHPQPLWVNKF